MSSTITEAKQSIVRQPQVLADDERGKIIKLDQGGDQSILLITSKKGTVRANHYHQHDSHDCYVLSGKIRYVERDLVKDATGAVVYDDTQPLREYVIEAGQCFYTAPLIAHAMEFLEDTEFLAISPRSGKQAEYENDVVRVTVVDPVEAQTRAKA